MTADRAGPEDTWPVSCKAVVLAGNGDSGPDVVLLAANERNEWELPGGRLEHDEDPPSCVVREVAEETGLTVEVVAIIDSWVYEPVPGRRVLIVTYGCRMLVPIPSVAASDEHDDVRFLPLDRLDRLAIPTGYVASILAWAGRGHCDGPPW